jgi:hypothetical protein
MPVYQYIDENSCRTVELLRRVEERDLVPAGLRRVCVPVSLAVVGSAPDPGHVDNRVRKAFKDLEGKIGHEAITRESQWTHRDIKRIWEM